MSDINPSGTKWKQVAGLAARQHGVVSRTQMRAVGVTDSAIAKALGSGRLHRAFRGTYGVGHPLIGEHARMMAGVLACGPSTVVSHLTAAQLLGLRDRSPSLVELVSHGDRGRGIEGIRRHHVQAPCGAEAGRVGVIPCTSPARTIVDLAGMLGERAQRRVVEGAAVRGILDVEAVEQIMAVTRRRGAPVLRRILADWQPSKSADRGRRGKPDLRSELEARLLALITATRLPAPRCNQRVDTDAESFVVDFLWPARCLVVETDGERFHNHRSAFESDRMRDRALQLAGYRVVRFTYRHVGTEPDAVVATIRQLLGEGIG